MEEISCEARIKRDGRVMQEGTVVETSRGGRRDSGYDETDTGNTHVGGGPRAGAVAVVGASCWDGGGGSGD